MKEVFAIVFKDTGEILTPKVFDKYWPNYGSSGLCGWRPPKKIYYTLGTARSGFSHIPDKIKPKLAIATFGFVKLIEDGAELYKKQEANRGKREALREQRDAEYQMKAAQAALERAQQMILDAKQGRSARKIILPEDW